MNGNGSSSGRWHKNRPILADVTNQHGKRTLLSISSSPRLVRENRFLDNVEGKEPDSEFVQKVCLGVENLVRGKCKQEVFDHDDGKDLPLAKSMGLCRLLKSSDSGTGPVGGSIENKGPPTDLDGDGRRNCCISGGSGSSGSEQYNKMGNSASVIVEGGSQNGEEHANACVGSDAAKTTLENAALDAADAMGDDDELMDAGDVASIKDTLAGSSSHPASEQGMCADSATDVADGFNANQGLDMRSVCSCSFCLKAAYIWSDIHYQDIKGRIAALKKSRKEVKFHADRSLNQHETDKNGMDNLNKSPQLELDLIGRSKSLFLLTDNILLRESNQLQSSLFSLKELRGSCKTELDITNACPLDKK